MTTQSQPAASLRETAQRLGDEAIQLAEALIAHPSEIVPNGGTEGPAQHFLADFLKDKGYDTIDVFTPDSVAGAQEHKAWWPNQTYTDRPNVVAVRKGKGGGRNLILNGHMDVVPAGDRAQWAHDPFDPIQRDGYLYGRGACDMKSGIAVMCMAMEALRQAGIQLAGDVILESVVCEETGVYNGTLACCLKGYKADGAVVLEPTNLDICTGLKGNHVYEVEIPGKATHNCLWWRGNSAFDHAIYFKEGMKRFEDLRTAQLRQHPLYHDADYFPTPALVDDIWYLKAGEAHFFAVPDQAKLMFMVEMLPGENREQVKQQFEQYMGSWCAAHPYLKDHPPVFHSPDFRPIYPTAVSLDDPLVQLMQQSLTQLRGQRANTRGFESACDAMTLTLWGDTPAIMYGPGLLENAHEINERVELAQIRQAVVELAEFIRRYCGD